MFFRLPVSPLLDLFLSPVVIHDVAVELLLDLVGHLLARVAHLLPVEEGQEEVVHADQGLDVLVGSGGGG